MLAAAVQVAVRNLAVLLAVRAAAAVVVMRMAVEQEAVAQTQAVAAAVAVLAHQTPAHLADRELLLSDIMLDKIHTT